MAFAPAVRGASRTITARSVSAIAWPAAGAAMTSHRYRPATLLAHNYLQPSAFARQRRSVATEAEIKAFEDYYSSISPGRRKFWDALKAYKQEHYNNALPRRFMGTIFKAVDANRDGLISFDELMALVRNVEADFAEEDARELIDEMGVTKEGGGDEKFLSIADVEEKWSPMLNAMFAYQKND